MNASSVNWRNKIHDNITKKNILQFFFTKFWIGKFLRQFWGNLEEIRVQKNTAPTLDRKQCYSQSF